MELRPAFEIEISALKFISAVGNYQQTTTKKQAAYTSVGDVEYSFRRSEASKRELPDRTNYGGNEKCATKSCG